MNIYNGNKDTEEEIINTNKINSNNNISIKEMSTDGMDLLSNKKKVNVNIVKEENVFENEDESDEEIEEIDEEEIELDDEEVEIDDDEEVEIDNDDEEIEIDDEEVEIDDDEEEYEEENNNDNFSFEDIQKEKQDLLFKLNRMQSSGSKLTRQYTMDSKIEDIRSEYRTLKKQRELKKSIKFSREMLMACVGGIEFLNNKFDPLDVKLDGWSESVMENIDNYDEVFEELYDKYNEKVDIAPEIRLIMMVGGSAFMYHLTNSLFKAAIPNVNDILKQNPDLMSNIQQATMNTMNNNAKTSNSPPPVSQGMFSNMMNFGSNNQSKQDLPKNNESSSMKGPTGVDDILNQIHQHKNTDKKNINLNI